MSLALLESTALFAAVCGTIFVWGHPLLSDWLDVAAAPGQAAGLSLCCIAGVALILVAGFYGLFPDTRIAEGPFLSSVLVMSGLLPLRAVGHGIMRRRAFVDRALVVGTGPRARKLVGEIRGA